MSAERTGIVEEGQRRASLFARFLGRPVPPPAMGRPVAVDLKADAEPAPEPLCARELQRVYHTLRTENDRLRLLLTLSESDRAKKAKALEPAADRMTSPQTVMDIFCAAMTAAGEKIDGSDWTPDHLRSRRRSMVYVWPRHVCIVLVRALCPRNSLPQIATAFGLEDHTSVMHACRRAPDHLRIDARLRTIHDNVLAAFATAAP